ncbi:hypothetical protein ILYODFUR_036278 [Ilyodon furcidens]|uniref:Uncharacterized protein n=1 Tax=Ilyodon furcidens TaxID=33524 RepID=A0ABV0VLJ6_9TELE
MLLITIVNADTSCISSLFLTVRILLLAFYLFFTNPSSSREIGSGHLFILTSQESHDFSPFSIKKNVACFFFSISDFITEVVEELSRTGQLQFFHDSHLTLNYVS